MLRKSSALLVLLAGLALTDCDDETVLDAIPAKDAATDTSGEAGKEVGAGVPKDSSADAPIKAEDGSREAATDAGTVDASTPDAPDEP
jgi:hypothetical protein